MFESGNRRSNGDLMESRMPLRSVMQILATVVSVGSGCWYLASSFDHRITALETSITLGRASRDVQVNTLQEAVTTLKDSNNIQNTKIADIELRIANFMLRFETIICHISPRECQRQP